jgi:hypothetical protein
MSWATFWATFSQTHLVNLGPQTADAQSYINGCDSPFGAFDLERATCLDVALKRNLIKKLADTIGSENF